MSTLVQSPASVCVLHLRPFGWFVLPFGEIVGGHGWCDTLCWLLGSHHSVLLVGDSRKLEFTTKAFSMSDPTLRCNEVPEAVAQAIAWVANSEGTEVRDYRENVVSEIERMGRELRDSGASDR